MGQNACIMFQYYLPSAEPLELTLIFPRSYVWQPPFVKWTLIHFLWPKLKCIESGISHGTLHDITQCHWQSLAQLKLFGNVSNADVFACVQSTMFSIELS